MKVSSIHDGTESYIGQLGKDISKPGIYKCARENRPDTRLIVMDKTHKFYWVPGSGPLRIQNASSSLYDHWVPVKEKITITFDTTEE